MGILDTALAIPGTVIGTVVGTTTAVLGGVGGVSGPTGPAGEAGGGGLLTGGGVLDVFDPVFDLVAQIVALPVGAVDQALSLLGGGIPGIAISAAGGAEAFARQAPIDTTGFSRGNGRQATRTIVQTLDLATGRIVTTRTLPGSPHLMNSEIRAAKKVFRQTAKLHAKLPRRTVKEGEVTKLKNAAVAAAIANVTCPPKCP